jgi:hypothetical protein
MAAGDNIIHVTADTHNSKFGCPPGTSKQTYQILISKELPFEDCWCASCNPSTYREDPYDWDDYDRPCTGAESHPKLSDLLVYHINTSTPALINLTFLFNAPDDAAKDTTYLVNTPHTLVSSEGKTITLHHIPLAPTEAEDLEEYLPLTDLIIKLLKYSPDSPTYERWRAEYTRNFRSIPQPRSPKQQETWPHRVREFCYAEYGRHIKSSLLTQMRAEIGASSPISYAIAQHFANCLFYRYYTAHLPPLLKPY